MELPAMLQGESLTRMVQGAAAGAIVAMIVGFSWGGWTLGSAVQKIANERAEAAVVAALAPICAVQFRQSANAAANLIELNKFNYPWDRETFIEKGDWAKMPGSETADSTVASACAERLGSLKAADVQ
jgi:alpha/beta superfamily hydrolase